MINKRYRKPHQYKKRKSIFHAKFLVFGFLLVLFSGAVFYGLFFWKVFWVEKVVVSGEEKISQEDIKFLVDGKLENKTLFLDTKSIFKVDTDQIKDDILTTFPQVASAEVRKSFFDTVNVEITERSAVAVWCGGGEKCFLLDEKGVIFEEASKDAELLLIETNQSPEEAVLGSMVVPQEKVSQVLTIQFKLNNLIQIPVTTAKILDERLDVLTREGWTIRFNLKGDLDWQITELKLALEKQISPEKRRGLEYIDLRFSRVYYK